MDKTSQNHIFTIFSFVASTALILFGVYSHLTNVGPLGIFEIATGCLILLNVLVYFFTKSSSTIYRHILTLIVFLVLVALLRTGGIENTGIFWFFMFPTTTFLLLGRREGSGWIAALCLLAIGSWLLMLIAPLSPFAVAYDETTLRQMTATLLVITILAYIYEGTRAKSEAKLVTEIGKRENAEDAMKRDQGRLRTLYEISNSQGKTVADQFREALKIGSTTLETRVAMINHIVGDNFTIQYAVVPVDTVHEGEQFSLKETYCDITVRKDDVVAINAMSVSEYKAHVCYSKFGLESYIGVPIKLNGELFGTLTFLDPDPHRPTFSESDKDFVRLMGAWVSATLERAEVDKMKSEFVSLASHQLNTPLSTINWFTDLLLTDEQATLNYEQKKYVNGIAEASSRMVDLVDALLNVSRIEMGTFAVTPVPVKFQEVTDSLLSELDHQMKEKKLEVSKEFDPSIPAIPADQSLMRIVFQNLLTNAIKYNKDEGKLSIKIIRKPEYKDMVYCEVSDTGLGVPKKDQSQIFQKLFRADNARMKITDGNGLGLYIVKAIIESAGGAIWFSSEENKGTTFSFTIPIEGMKAKAGSKALAAGEKHTL